MDRLHGQTGNSCCSGSGYSPILRWEHNISCNPLDDGVLSPGKLAKLITPGNGQRLGRNTFRAHTLIPKDYAILVEGERPCKFTDRKPACASYLSGRYVKTYKTWSEHGSPGKQSPHPTITINSFGQWAI